ncbi:sigma-70 family RNA polymerase sigma factor [Streptomyces sp. NPDC055817]
MSELLSRLRRAAIDGAVPEAVFMAQARVLGLGDIERERLREELAGLGLPVRGIEVHADGDSPDVEKVALIREENVCVVALPFGDVLEALLSRYADSEGYVTSRAVDGVARLAGLGTRDAAALRVGARIRVEPAVAAEAPVAGAAAGRETATSEAAAPGGAVTATGLTDFTDAEEHASVDVSADESFPLSDAATGGDIGDVAGAVAAALAVLEGDRFRRRPDMHLLSAEAEVGLAVLVRGGPDHMAEEPDDEILSSLPPDDLRIRARDCFVLHNQRLVHKMVPRYLEQGLDYDDLFQHGALGLMRAARKFDPAKGFKFSTYATWWVRQSITRGIADEGAVIRIPVHMHEQIRKVALAERTLAVQGRPAGVADVAVYCDMTTQKVAEARKLSRRIDSLDRVIGDGVTLGDFIGWTNPLPPVERGVLDSLLLEQIMSVVDTLTEREARILVRRLGLDGDDPSTLDELGKEIGVTRERVRQIESKTKTKFKYRLTAAGLTAAYQYDGGLEGEPDNTGEPASTQRSGSGAGAGGEGRKASSGGEQVPGMLPTPAPGKALTDSARDMPPEARTTPTQEQEQEQEGRRSQEGSGDSRLVTDQRPGAAVVGLPAEAGLGPVAKPVLDSAPERSHAAQADTERDGPSVPEPTDLEAPQYTADWQKALRMPTDPGGGVTWLAEYALLALGLPQLTVLLGPSTAEAVAHAVRDQGVLDPPVITALEVLRRVFDAVKAVGLRPEDFFERPAEALVGMTPREYLAAKPLVRSESRLALRESLRAFTAEVPPRVAETVTRADTAASPDGPPADTLPDNERPQDDSAGSHSPPLTVDSLSAYHGRTDEPTVPEQPASLLEAGRRSLAAGTPENLPATGTEDRGIGWDKGEAEAEQRLTDVRREYEAELTRVRDEAQRHLAEERQAADARDVAAHADIEQQLDALEEALLQRTDKALLRKEQHLRALAEGRIARLKVAHREAQQTLVEHAERAEQRERAARTALDAAAERATRAERRADDAKQFAGEAEQRAHDAQQRASEAEERAAVLSQRAEEAQRRAEEAGQRLRRYREEGEIRIVGLEYRLRQAEAVLAERDGAVRASEQRAADQVAAAEQRAAARIAQTEHDAWSRIAELQQQLAAEREATVDRSTFRDRWRRS